MTAKERRNLKHTLKTNIDSADLYIKIADIGETAGVNSPKNKDITADKRAFVVNELTTLKQQIADAYSKFMSEIDNAISNLM